MQKSQENISFQKDHSQNKPNSLQKPQKSNKADEQSKNKINQQVLKVVAKGTVPIDPNFSITSQARVLSENGITYAATLNQSNLANNNNKFYIVQVVELMTNPRQYYFLTRWGRVGVVGQISYRGPISREKAINLYETKINNKIKMFNFKLVEMNYQVTFNDKDEIIQDIEQKSEIPSELDQKIQELIKLIFDMKMMNKQMKQIGYDAKKMPLGKLAKSSILKGYQALNMLMDQVSGNNRKQRLSEYSSDFYSYIPHDFGFVKMQHFILDTQKKIKQKLQMLQSLEDIQIFTKILDEGKVSQNINEMDSNYLKLSTQITPLDKASPIYSIIIDYVKNTHAASHNNFQIEVQDIFAIRKQQEFSRFTENIPNKQLLWHGSRLTNYVGILSQGLRIAPPEAPVTGYMFGKGVYFADIVSKSAKYCVTNKLNNTGLMLLCEVALGESNQKKMSDFYANVLSPGKSSTKGLGKHAPQSGVFWQGIFVPNGKVVSTNITDTSLLYNEYIVYNVSQIRCRFMLKIKFHYKI